MDDFIEFIKRNLGIIIGLIVGLVAIGSALYDLIIKALIVLCCAYAGFYIQNNKDKVKDAIRKFLDKM